MPSTFQFTLVFHRDMIASRCRFGNQRATGRRLISSRRQKVRAWGRSTLAGSCPGCDIIARPGALLGVRRVPSLLLSERQALQGTRFKCTTFILPRNRADMEFELSRVRDGRRHVWTIRTGAINVKVLTWGWCEYGDHMLVIARNYWWHLPALQKLHTGTVYSKFSCLFCY